MNSSLKVKTCSKCGEVRSVDFYQKDRTKHDGFYSSCKDCCKKAKIELNEKLRLENKKNKEEYVLIKRSQTTKFCNKCKQELSLDSFHKRKESTDGKVANCKECRKKYNQHLYIKNKETYTANSKRWRQKPESKEKIRVKAKTVYKDNKTYHSALRRSLQRKAAPEWLTLEHKNQIKDIYKSAKTRSVFHETIFEVDHVEPLKGKTSCGLHVPWNLQVIDAAENRSKGNKLLNIK